MQRRWVRRFLISLLVLVLSSGVLAPGWPPLRLGARALAQAPTVQTRTTALGTVLTGSDGRTLYTLSADTPGVSRCTDQCPTAWPPLELATGTPVAPAGLGGRLGVITRPDGRRQVTYNDQPLYFFVRDTEPGTTNGEGVNAFGGVWHVARPQAAAPGAAPAAPAAPQAQRPAAAPAAPQAQRPAAAPAQAALPRTGTGALEASAGSLPAFLTGLAVMTMLLGGAGALAYARRR